MQVVEAMEGPLALNRCLTLGEPCNRQTWCAAHTVWAEAQEAMARVLQSASISRLARESQARLAELESALAAGKSELVEWN
jgi:DNA-binding IscR family transcriptional regulator